MEKLKINIFRYKHYTFDNGTHLENPQYSYFGSEESRSETTNTIVVHSIYIPANEEKGASKSYSAEECKNLLEENEVSTHYLIDRDGVIFQMVEEDRLAWHAGKSQMPEPDNRTKVNAFSLGVELIGDEQEGFTDEQYESFVGLVVQIMDRLPIENILGHNDISGTRVRPDSPKTDPWNFDWNRFFSLLILSMGEEKVNQLKLVGHNV